MSGQRAGAGEPGSRGARAAPSHIAAMQLFHELKQQFPALPDHAVSACIAQHLHDPRVCHSQLQQATTPRSLPYPASLRLDNHMEEDDVEPSSSTDSTDEHHPLARSPRLTDIQTERSSQKTPTLRRSNRVESRRPSPKMDLRKSRPLSKASCDDLETSPKYLQTKPEAVPPKGCPKSLRAKPDSSPEETVPSKGCDEFKTSPKAVSGSERTPPTSPSDIKDFSPFSSKPPMSPSTSKKPPGRASKPYDARIMKLPEDSLGGAVRRTSAVRPASLDLPKRTSDSADSKTSPVQGVNLSVNVNCSVGVVEPGNGQARRHSAVLEVTPEPTWLHPSYPPSPRSYTSVNLTLRTPTTPPQGPIDICSSPAPASLTYTTSSFDRRQGLQSRLQITVGPGPGVGSVTATRTRPRSCYQEQGETEQAKQRAESMPDLSGSQLQDTTNHVVLLSRQKERKEQLRNELKAGKERLHSIKKEIEALRLENTPEYRTKLKKDIRHLQAQCERLTREVDRHSESRVPLGETNEEFYRHIYTGQRPPSQRRRVPPSHSAANEPDNEPRWPCHICTFRNHPLMDKCEQCEMPRVLLVSAGPGENIHIRFSPGNTTRVIHSWVV